MAVPRWTDGIFGGLGLQPVVADGRDLAEERERLSVLIDQFAVGGAAGCTKHPHSF